MKPLSPELKQMLMAAIADARASNKPPSFPMYVNDWLGSASIAAMNATQEGGYIRLMNLCWATEDLSLPHDEAKLAAMSRLNGDWPTLGKAILDCFSPHTEPGKITHRRLIQERFRQMEYRNKQALKADKRWRSLCRADATALPEHCPRKATAMLSPLSFLLCPLSDCPFHILGKSGQKPDSPERKPKGYTDEQKEVVRVWCRLFADCFREVNGTWPMGYDPDSARFPEPKIAQAALWFFRNATTPDGIQPNIRPLLLAVLRGEFYASPPANLAEFRAMFNKLTDANRKSGNGKPGHRPVKSVFDQYRSKP